MEKQCKHCSITFTTDDKRRLFCTRSCSALHNSPGRVHSEATRRKLSEYAKKNPTGWAADHSLMGDGPRIKIDGKWTSTTRLPREKVPCVECGAQFEKMIGSVDSQNRLRKYCSRECSNKNNFHPNSTIRHRSVYKGYQMDSGAERAFAELLDSHDIVWSKNKDRSFPFIDDEGKARKYFPDFYLPEYNFWVEIKGKRYVRKNDHLRLAAVGDNIELIMSHELRLPSCVKNGEDDGIRTHENGG